ncbi:MIP/aquaporin family protein [Paenarthrobacter nitroguajacolicus]
MTSPVQATPEHQPGLLARLSAEALGSMFVVVVGLGVSMFSFPTLAPLPAALATGLAVTAAMLAFGYVSGGHFNPAITLGNLIAGRIRALAAVTYIAAQVIGSLVAAALVYFVALNVKIIPDARSAFGVVASGFGEHSAAQAQMAGVLLLEIVGSALLVAVYLGATAGVRAVPALAPFAVGLAVAVLLQFGQVLGNIPFNPARATAQAIFSPSWALEGLWLFWVAPLMGAALAGLAFRGFQGLSQATVAVTDDVQGGSDGVNDSFDANDEPVEDVQVNEAPEKSDEDASRRVPAAPVSDDARDFFDGKKGK